MKSILRRWNSDALDTIALARESRPAGVHLTGTAGSGKSELRRELSRFRGIEFTDSAADSAVVLIVVDASAPIGRVDVEQWRRALESTPVVFVVNKIDVHRRWREVVVTDGDVVAEYVPRAVECSFHPTSVRLARAGRESDDAALWTESGLGAVADRLEVLLLGSAALGAQRKYVAAVQHCASEARSTIVAKARAVNGGSESAPLRARRAALVGERENLGGDRRALLRNRIQRVRVETLHAAGEDVRELGVGLRQSIDRARRPELKHLPAHVAESVLGARSRAHAALTAGLRAVESDLGITSTTTQSNVGDAPLDIGAPSRRRGIEDAIMIVVGASAGVGLGRLVVSPLALMPAWTVLSTVITLVLGGALAWWLTRSRSLLADRAHARGWTQESLARVKSVVEQQMLSRILEAESALAAAVADADRDAAARIDAELAEVDVELRRLADHRSTLLSACDRDLFVLERGLERFQVPVEPFDVLVRRSR
ncbi:hypothetical protein ACIGGF_19495 [Rhodococcus sp. NPDC078407]|uniref:hypothetical protein n=1 Tax=Rhodococcus sp. NPDC078407 TaxID=3364509 RepID=UPI0037CA6DCF